MNAKELQDFSEDQLKEKLAETKEELFNIRFQNATGQLDNYKRIGELRKDVARIKTLLRQQELGSASDRVAGKA